MGQQFGSTLMRDDLRAKGYLPSTEPYSSLSRYEHVGNDGGGETVVSTAVFQMEGPDAIVDWLFIELRDKVVLDSVIATRSALLQRDGDVVDVDGISALQFPSLAPGEYHVAVRHRNHLGVMTENAIALGNDPAFIDFTDVGFDIYGADEFSQVVINGKRALWGGDLNHDGRLIFQGPGNDVYPLFTQVLLAPGNTSLLPNYMVTGYDESDIDLDGFSIYMGPGNDKQKLFTEVMARFYALFPPNITCCWNYVIIETLP